jgi:cellulose synthase/poly-beta-1,6-N-acetylglucosamine synthase-like glycosyltransferase/peptidoglycan/xylan/chitin deacetylase (PgdA/CDA1 family)/spore germination protein YaaH
MSSPQLAAPRPQVFLEPTGQRWRRLRNTFVYFVVAPAMLLLLVTGINILVPPLVPKYPLTQQAPSRFPKLTLTGKERSALTKRMQLFFNMEKSRIPRSRHPLVMPLPTPRKGRPLSSRAPKDPVVAGFFVNWDDNSLVALRAHADDLDWVICEWGFIAGSGDSLRLSIKPQVFASIDTLPESKRPQLFVMVSNYDSVAKKWSPAALRHMLTTPQARSRAVQQLASLVTERGLLGVTIDFEQVPDDLVGAVVRFTREIKQALPEGRLVTQTLQTFLDDRALARYAAANDKLFLMLFDEHYGRGDAGPVASQQWYVQTARRMLRYVPPDKAILMVGAFGYDWNDADTTGAQAVTYQEMTALVRDAQQRSGVSPLRFDSLSLNPYATWSDPDSTDHVLWFLDGVTAYNEILAGQSLGVAGHAIWRLGAEDPAIWSVIGKSGLDGPPDELRTIPSGYDPEILGQGEILQIAARPTNGAREIRVDSATKLVVDERITSYATPYIVRRYGSSEHKVALTFDDGPDGRWTPLILDTLKKYHAPATFFVIGENVQAHIPLMRRVLSEGHEFGNHTFTHPNLALASTRRTKLEIDANERLLEATLNRRTAFWRPPYFGDAEPTTEDELVPVGVATDRGYITVGLHVDSFDWWLRDPKEVVDSALAQRPRGNIVLLHDGGGDRTATVAALGPLIDSLRAHGDTLVRVSELIGISPQVAMPRLPPTSAAARMGELLFFGGMGVVEWVLYWTFFTALILGFARLFFLSTLAIIQRLKRHQNPDAPITYAPAVSVVVPAFNEEMVICRTIETLLSQKYPGPIDVIVVDDGSPDATSEVARRDFGSHPRVSIFRKSNGGKASALNYGLAVAKGEIVVCLDADTLFAPNTIAELVQPLADPKVGAVAGNAKVGNRINLVTRWQAIEYVTSQNLDRRAFSLLNAITVVPGAVGAWRKALVLEAGGFSDDTLAEDQDLTMAIRRRGYEIEYADEAIGYTEAPDTLATLARQRFRWSFGTLQCLWKHSGIHFWRQRGALLRPNAGSLGFIALPNVWIFQIIYPFISPIADLLFVWSLISVWAVRADHGATFALSSLQHVLTYYAVFLVVDWVATMLAFALEPGEDKSLTWLVLLQRFVYRQLMYWVVVRSIVAAFRGRLVGWGKLERKATVEVPTG